MHSYRPDTPRIALGIAALALSALTLGLTIVAPASLAPDGAQEYALAARESFGPGVTEVQIIPARIDVRGVRAPDLAAAGTAAPAECTQQRT